MGTSHTHRDWLLLVQIPYTANHDRNTLGQPQARSHRHFAVCRFQEMQILLSETAVVYQPNFLTLGEPTNEQNMDNRLGASHTSRIWLLLVQISYIANDGRNTLGQALARSHRHLAICWHQEIQPQAC